MRERKRERDRERKRERERERCTNNGLYLLMYWPN